MSLSNLGSLGDEKRKARNPKVYKFTVRIDETTNRKLEEMADALGANKGTVAALAMAAGLNAMEPLKGPRDSPYITLDQLHLLDED